MVNIALSFAAENGISLDDAVGIFTGVTDPGIVGEDAPVGSLYIRQDGSLYQKFGLNLTDWIRFSQGLGEAVKISATDTTAGYLNPKLLVSSALTKTVGNSGANETLTLDIANVGVAGTYRSVTTNSKGQVTAGTNPTTIAGYGIVDAQPLDADLTAIAAQAGTGYLTRTGTNTWATRSLLGTTNQINIITGNGSTSNTTIGFVTTNLTFPGTSGVILPRGTTAQRVATTATIRYNDDISTLEYYNGTVWVPLVASTGGTVTSVSVTQPSAGLTITGGPITTSGTFTFSLSNDLAAVEGLVGTGFAARTGGDTWATRALVGTADRLTITNGDGIAGSPLFDIASTYAGQASITTLGVIGTGTWQGTTISTAFGGTGRTSIGTANQMLGVNTTGSGLEYKTISNGTGIGLSFSGGLIQINNTGVTSVAGTTNQVIASSSTGAVTLSLPQNIHTAATPTFAAVTVAADPTLPLQLATKQYVDNAVQGVSPKQSVRAGTTGPITLTGAQTVDGVAVIAGDRVLVKNQAAPADSGIYIVAAGTWARAIDFDSWAEVPGAFVFVEEGTTLADTAWVSTADQGGTLGTTAMPWVQFSSAADIQVSTGLTRVGNTISITPVGTAGSYNNVTTNALGQVISGSNVAYITANQTITLQGDVSGSGTTLINTTLSNTGIAAGTYRSLTIDAKGRATAGTNPTTLAGYGITDAQPLNTFLTSQSGLASNGIVIRNGNVALTRSITAGSTRVSVTNADGVAGNPTIDVVEANLALNNISGTLSVAKGGTNLTALGTANQVLGVNTGGNALEYKTITAGVGVTITPGTGAITIAATNNGTVTSVAATGSTGLTVGGSPITGTGTLTFTLGAELQGLSSLAVSGLVTRTAAGTYTSRSIVSGNGTITITNPLGTAGNIGLDLATAGTAGTYRSVTTDQYGRVTSGTNPTTLAGYGITDAIPTSEKGAPNGVATLDAGGRLPVAQLPATAITDTFVVASQAAQVALTAEVGDVAVRTDLNRSFILRALPASTFSNWQELLTPTDAVLSVNGQTGAVSVGTVTSVAVSQPVAGLTITGGPITTSGTLTFALANDLAAVENLATNGIAVRTGTSTWATRSLTAGTGISITNADGVGGNPTISATSSGTVTSVALALPSIFSVTGSPITAAGTLTAALNTQAVNTVLAGPTIGSPAVPTFRTLGLATNDLNDVTITSATTNQVLAYNGTRWVNTGAVGSAANGLVGVGQAAAAAWVLIAGSQYRADFVHNLGTTNVVITVFDSLTNTVVIPDQVVLVNANTVRIQVVGNTRTLRVVVVANGQAIVAGGSTPSSVIVAKDGVDVGTATRVNFTGQAVGVANSGGGTVTVGIGARFTYFANSLDTPVNSDFVVNSLSPAVTDPTYPSLNVRSFSNTVEQGVACTLSIPPGMTNVTFKFRGRPTTAPGAASVVQPRLCHRRLPNNAAVAAWSAAQELANIVIPTNANFQYATQTVALSALGLVADSLYQFEFTRRVTGVTGTNLANAFLLAELTVEFS